MGEGYVLVVPATERFDESAAAFVVGEHRTTCVVQLRRAAADLRVVLASDNPNPNPNPTPSPSPNQLYTRNESTAWSRAEAEFDRICVHYGLSCVSLYEVRLSPTTSIA